jgi:formylglycine-generating enzyme required for sulfatase activity
VSDERRLTPEEQALLRRYLSIDGDGNVVGDNNEVTVTEQTAGNYAVQIGEQRILVRIGELRHILNVEYRSDHYEARLNGDGAVVQGKGAVGAGREGIAVGGEIHGDVTVTVTYQGNAVAIPSREAIAAHCRALAADLQTATRRWGGVARYIQEEGSALPIEASPYDAGRLGAREGLLPALHRADRLLVLGGAGSGKTVSLQRLAWDLCQSPEASSIPVMIKLFRYDGAPLAEWVRPELQRMGRLRIDGAQALAAFLKEGPGRCVFLFDGLNEVQPDYRDALVGALVRWANNYPRHPVILTSRPQDEVWRRLRDAADRALVVQPITEAQVQAYLRDHLGDRGVSLYDQLDERLRTMARTPLILWLIKEAGEAEESIPGNRGELYWRFVSRMLRRDTQRRMDAGIPERLKRRALADIAYHLGQDKRLVCPREDAVAVVARRRDVDARLAEDVIGACARHGLLAGDQTLWFVPHQTVQEHFAALALREIAQREWALTRWQRLKRGAKRVLTGESDDLNALAADDWWMETFVQLAGLVDDTDRLVREIVRVNPWLAWWCVGEGRGVSEETQEAVENRSIRLLASENVADRRRVVAALAQIRNERTVDPLFRAAGDPDDEVVWLAVQALAEMGESARQPILEALKGTDPQLWKTALKCLRAQPESSLWVEVPDQMWNEMLETTDRLRATKVWARMPSASAVAPLFRSAGDKDDEVAGLAVQALVEMGEVPKEFVSAFLRGTNGRLKLAGLRYLLAQPDRAFGSKMLEGVLGQSVVRVPPGPFLMGSDEDQDPQAHGVELPQHEMYVPGYWIGRYPVTVAQFRAFVEESGYEVDERSLDDPDDHPVRYVSWHDARAYCHWLSEETGLTVRLPSEAEWEKAARGTDGRIYPWGDERPTDDLCNYGNSKRGTTPVGRYLPLGGSPYGCADMAGNVWEWTRSLYDSYPYDPSDGREDPESDGPRILRGGAFFSLAGVVRCAYRPWNVPINRNRDLGVRVVVSPSL